MPFPQFYLPLSIFLLLVFLFFLAFPFFLFSLSRLLFFLFSSLLVFISFFSSFVSLLFSSFYSFSVLFFLSSSSRSLFLYFFVTSAQELKFLKINLTFQVCKRCSMPLTLWSERFCKVLSLFLILRLCQSQLCPVCLTSRCLSSSQEL